MIPGMPPAAPPHMAAPMTPPHAPAGPSPLIALLMQHAHAGGAPPMGHPGGMAPQAAGAPMPLGAGGHPAGRFGHAPPVIPGQ